MIVFKSPAVLAGLARAATHTVWVRENYGANNGRWLRT